MSTPKQRHPIIDTDVHPYPMPGEIDRRLDEKWRYLRKKIQIGKVHPKIVNAHRADAIPPGYENGYQCSDPDFTRKQLIDEYGIEHAILLPRAFANMMPNPEMSSAVAAAFNDWLAETWLDAYNSDGVFKGSITVATNDPEGAVREIERWAGHPHFVQVMTDSGSRHPFGHRRFHPIYEACEKHGYPFAIHPGSDGLGVNNLTSPGWMSHYFEFHTCHFMSLQAHLVSFIAEGVFEKYPGFKLAMVEGGVAWLTGLMWRFDQEYKAMRHEVPWCRKPSEYLREHVRLTSQPLERPDDDKHLLQMLEMMDAEHLLMFSSDYPHFDFDSPVYAFPKLPETMHRRIFYENAKQFYSL